MTTVPGGVTVTPTAGDLALALAKILEIKNIVETVHSHVFNEFIPHLQDEHPETFNLLLEIGVGPRNFLAYGVFPQPSENYAPTIPGGFLKGGELKPVNVDAITEYVTHSWYEEESGGKPSESPPPRDEFEKTEAYSWIKSPRYNGLPCEVGPLARLRIAGLYKPLSRHGASLIDRILARLEETLLVAGKLSEWIFEVSPGKPVYTEFPLLNEAEGYALWEAPRGALGHWVKIGNKVIERYQIISPTTWNASPRDANGVRGPIEEALVGAPVPGGKDRLNVLRIIRSFDPCLACSVH